MGSWHRPRKPMFHRLLCSQATFRFVFAGLGSGPDKPPSAQLFVIFESCLVLNFEFASNTFRATSCLSEYFLPH